MQIDRHIAVSSGWVAGPAFSVAMMAAPDYFGMREQAAAICFWGGCFVFLATLVTVWVLSTREREQKKMTVGPIIMMGLGLLLFGAGATWYFYPRKLAVKNTASIVQTIPPEPIPQTVKANLLFTSPFAWFGEKARIELVIINETDRPFIVRSFHIMQRKFSSPDYAGAENEKYLNLAYKEPRFFPSFLTNNPEAQTTNYPDGSTVSMPAPTEVEVDGREQSTAYTSIPSNSTSRILATFPTTAVSESFNISVLSPIFSILRDDGSSGWITCRGMILFLAKRDKPPLSAVVLGPEQLVFTLKPEGNDKNCRLSNL